MGLDIGKKATDLGLNIARKAGGDKKGLDIAQESSDGAFDMVGKIVGGFKQQE